MSFAPGANPSGTGDIGGPMVTGLSDDDTVRASKTWTWDCNDTCTFRFAINQQPQFIPTGDYSSVTTAALSSGDGTFYIHVQAQNQEGLVSEVVHASAILDSTAPDLTGQIEFESFDRSETQTNLLSWPAADSGVAAIDRYEISISTEDGDDDCDDADVLLDVLDWTVVPDDANFEGAGYRVSDGAMDGDGGAISLTLMSATQYCIAVRAIDETSQVSGLIHSDILRLPFDPTEIPALGAWLDGNDASTLYQTTDCTTTLASSGNPVACWRDKSGNANHFTQTTASRRPIRMNNVVDFDGSDDVMTSSSLSYNASSVVSYFMITDFDTQSNVTSSCCRPLISFVTNSSALYPWIGSTRGNLFPNPDSIFHGWTGSPLNPIAASPGDSFIVGATHDGTNDVWNAYTNGVQRVFDQTIPASYSSTTVLSLGGDTNNGARRYHGTIKEMVLYNAILNTSQIQDVEGYLACTWDVRDVLPVSHPYYNVDPTSESGCP